MVKTNESTNTDSNHALEEPREQSRVDTQLDPLPAPLLELARILAGRLAELWVAEQRKSEDP